MALITEIAQVLLPLECCADVILVGQGARGREQGQVPLGHRTDVTGGEQTHRTDGKLLGMVLLAVERIDELSPIVVLMAAETMGIIAFEEELGMQLGRGPGTQPKAQAINAVGGEQTAQRTDIDEVGMAVAAGPDIFLGQKRKGTAKAAQGGSLIQLTDEVRHALLGPRERKRPHLIPIGIGAGNGHGDILPSEKAVGKTAE